VAEPHDELLNRAIKELRTLPPLDQDAVSRIVSAAARSRAAGAAEDLDVGEPRRGRFFRLPAVIGIAAAAAMIGFVAGVQLLGTKGDGPANTGGSVAVGAAESLAVRPVAVVTPDADATRIVRQFTFRSRVAHRVTVVGDFNGWDPSANPMRREEGGALWWANVPLSLGRHVYAFLVDDTIMETDPDAPVTKDPDFGVKGSVVIVGKP
jgi:Carbohydrate-binding module 48 (Isoamylase N-terminal domain)